MGVGKMPGHAMAAAIDAVEHDVARLRAARRNLRYRGLILRIAVAEVGGGSVLEVAAVDAAPEFERFPGHRSPAPRSGCCRAHRHGDQRIGGAVHQQHRNRTRRMAGLRGRLGEIHDHAGGGREQIGAGADQRHRHRAAIGEAGDIDPLRIGHAISDKFLDQFCDEGDIVGPLRRDAAGALLASAQIGGPDRALGIEHREMIALGDQRPRAASPAPVWVLPCRT
jgi:hypothetical protein